MYYNVIAVRYDAFKEGASWVAFARLEPVVSNILKQEFGDDTKVWPDAAAVFFRWGKWVSLARIP